MQHDRLLENVKRLQHLPPLSRAANTYTGTGIDTNGLDEISYLICVGDIAATATLNAKVQESDDNSAWSDVSGAAITQLGDTDDNKTPSIGVRLGSRANRKRYSRISVTTANGAVVFGVEALLSGARQAPVVNSPASVLA